MNDVIRGAITGCLATAPMSVAMQAMFERLPRREQRELPPRTIAMRLAGSLGARSRMSEPAHRRVTLVSHFAMGASMGALFSAVRPRIPLPTPLAGIGLGLAVWGINYAGLLPRSGLYPPVKDQTSRRAALMVIAHLVWGAAADFLNGPLSGLLGRASLR